MEIKGDGVYCLRVNGIAPINESALCPEHYADPELRELALNVGRNAEDFTSDEWFHLSDEEAERNDTTCVECVEVRRYEDEDEEDPDEARDRWLDARITPEWTL